MDTVNKASKNSSTKDKFSMFFSENFNRKIAMRRVQKFGGWLSAMIMPVIGVIIGWGLLTSFFLSSGWTPVATIDKYIVGPTVNYLIPILIGYYAGRLVHKGRGGVIGAFATFGVIQGNIAMPGWWADDLASTPQFLGAMITAPIAAGVLKGFDKLVEGRIKTGFEMLVDNFSIAIIGAIMMLAAFYGMPYVTASLSYVFMIIVNGLIKNDLIFLAALIVEPAKVLFLNNGINHGIFTPLGTQMVQESGKSILFLLETNPGPGLGLLIAYMIFDKKLRAQAGGASIIQFFGGIHEVYFPFALMRPSMLIALISGGLVGDAIFQIGGAGLVNPASPGSIIAIFLAAGNSGGTNYAMIALGVVGACLTSLGVASLIFLINRKKYKAQQNDDLLNEAKVKLTEIKGKESKYNKVEKAAKKRPSLIIFACEAGMGSSAMGAGLLRKKLKAANINVDVKNYAVKELPADAEYVITQDALTELAKNKAPNAEHKSISNFLDGKFYDSVVDEMKSIE